MAKSWLAWMRSPNAILPTTRSAAVWPNFPMASVLDDPNLRTISDVDDLMA